MKQLRVRLIPHGWAASPSEGYPQQDDCMLPIPFFIHLGEETIWNNESYLPQQHSTEETNLALSQWPSDSKSDVQTSNTTMPLPCLRKINSTANLQRPTQPWMTSTVHALLVYRIQKLWRKLWDPVGYGALNRAWWRDFFKDQGPNRGEKD